jgi:ATP-dependent DNA helicase RecG
MDLNQPIESFRNIGSAYLKKLHKLKIKTLRDLFLHFPHRYNDFSNLKKISEVKIGEEATIEGKIKEITSRRSFRRRLFLTEAFVEDDSGTLKVIWFNQPYLTETLSAGTFVSLTGKIKSSPSGIIFSSPAYEKIKMGDKLKHTQGLVPVYPETEGLSSRWLRFIIYPLLKKNINDFKDSLPKEILKKKNLPELQKAIFNIHFPKTKEEADGAKKRFAFEELFLIQLILQKQKKKITTQKAPKLIPKIEYIEEFKKQLKFSLTSDQKKVTREILDDLQKEFPMSRLLEGEVGCGKTIVATLASFITLRNGYQATMMAPTGILAEQHFEEISKLLKKLSVKTALLTSEKAIVFYKNKKQKLKPENLIKNVKEGKINILIGTHSLIQERMKFKNLGLVVVDEQHRFGVEQRSRLTTNDKERKIIPHFLSMTATPIPRTLALAFYGDLSVSQIKELPKGRKKIITKIVPPNDRKEIYNFLRKEVKEEKQVFVICPLIEESEKLEIAAAKKEFERLETKIFPDLKLGLLHGKMKAKEKEKIMRNFKDGKVQVLVSTPVVEVGIDVPRATLMIIEGADRFGLAQLYQFRGRVGRGKDQSYCFLFTDSTAKTTRRRLKAIESAKDAFELSEKDLKIRGPGDFIGKRQSGIPDLTMASLTDLPLIKEAKEEAEILLLKDAQLKNHPLLSQKLKEFKKEAFLG